ncbi:hypothetical protein [Fictibacillus macauensis]|uniref:hypothetical protein n=1 Tax=Fictibacillus macauensis TaxID=245160 RepID=UPI0012EA20A5|nr:hypothetical protein [Fictibacillus macauensis]
MCTLILSAIIEELLGYFISFLSVFTRGALHFLYFSSLTYVVGSHLPGLRVNGPCLRANEPGLRSNQGLLRANGTGLRSNQGLLRANRIGLRAFTEELALYSNFWCIQWLLIYTRQSKIKRTNDIKKWLDHRNG